MSYTAKKKREFQFKKCGDFTTEESNLEYRRQMNERNRIATLRSQNGMRKLDAKEDDLNTAPLVPNVSQSEKISEKGWNQKDYVIKLNAGAVSKDADPFIRQETYDQFQRTPRCGDEASHQSTIETYRNGLSSGKTNAAKLSGSAARDIITFEGSAAQTTTPSVTTNSDAQASWNENNYRIKVATRKDGEGASVIPSYSHDTFARNQKCGDGGFSVDDFKLAKIEALQIKEKTNGGSAARDVLTQKGRVD
jgi:hypothetical protein